MDFSNYSDYSGPMCISEIGIAPDLGVYPFAVKLGEIHRTLKSRNLFKSV